MGLQLTVPSRSRPDVAGKPALAWRSRATTIDGIETELTRIWSQPSLERDIDGEGTPERHVGARTSVMNLVVVARRPEVGERCAAIIHDLTGRHPSRTLIVAPVDPDGPSWLDASIQAHCVLPSETAPATCAETIYLTCGGESGRHLEAIIAPLLIHDLPVTVWWPDELPFEAHADGRGPRAHAIDSSSTARRGTDRGCPSSASWPRSRSTARSRSRTSPSSDSRAGGRPSRRSSTTPTSCRSSGSSAGSA